MKLKRILVSILALLMLVGFSSFQVLAAEMEGDDDPIDATAPGVRGTIGANVDIKTNNNTNATNNANTNINISNSTVSNSNIGSNNKTTQTNTVSNSNAITVKKYVSVKVDGRPLNSDVKPFVNGDNRTVLPLRAIAEAFGAKVDWDAVNKIVTLTYGDKMVRIKLGEKSFEVNGQVFSMDTMAFSKDGRTFLPARAIAEALGLKVDWNAGTNTVDITKPADEATGTPAANQSGQTNTPSTGTTPSTSNPTATSEQQANNNSGAVDPNNLKVAGFKVTNFKGTVNPDGSFSGSGQLVLPFGGSVNATFTVNALGVVTSGSWSGNFNAFGRSLSVASGSFDSTGLKGNSGINIGGTQQQFSIHITPNGALTGSYKGSLSIGGRSLSNVSLTLNNANITGKSSVNILGSGVEFDIQVNASGQISGSARTALSAPLPGGKRISFSEATLSLASNGAITGTSSLNTGTVPIANASVNIDPSGGVSGRGNVNIGVGKITTNYSLSPTSFSVSGSTSVSQTIKVPVPNPLLIPPTIDAEFTLSASVSLSVKNFNEIVATASGSVKAPVFGTTSVSGSVNLVTGEFSVKVFGINLSFKLFK